MRTTVSSRGQIVIPTELRKLDGIKTGQQFEVERVEHGTYRLVRIEDRTNAGLVDLLLACPAKGYFTPIESESTDSI